MHPQLALSPDVVAAARSRIVAAHDELAERRGIVGSQAQTLLADGWRGVAAGQYAEAWERWQVAADQVLASMLDLCAATTLAQVQLEVADLVSAGTSSRLLARLAEG